MTRSLALFLCFILGCGAVRARDAGDDYYLLSDDGKFVRELTTFRGDCVDYEAELIYRCYPFKDNAISAFRFDSNTPVWTVQPIEPVKRLNFGVDGVLVVWTDKNICGFEKRSGKEIYRIPNRFLYRTGQSPFFTKTNGEVGQFAYLASGNPDTGKEAAPAKLVKLDLEKGAVVWEKEQAAVGDVRAGQIKLPEGNAYFWPPNGDPLSKHITGNIRAALYPDTNSAFYLAPKEKGEITELRAFDQQTDRQLWLLEGLKDATNFVGRYEFSRVMCCNNAELFVVDAQKGQLFCRIAITEPNHYNYLQTEKHIITVGRGGRKTLRCFDAATGAEVWNQPAKFFGNETGELPALDGLLALVRGKNQEIIAAQFVDGEQPGIKEQLSIVSRADADGRELWKWDVPVRGYFDSQGAIVHRCKSGLMVHRYWYIAE